MFPVDPRSSPSTAGRPETAAWLQPMSGCIFVASTHSSSPVCGKNPATAAVKHSVPHLSVSTRPGRQPSVHDRSLPPATSLPHKRPQNKRQLSIHRATSIDATTNEPAPALFRFPLRPRSGQPDSAAKNTSPSRVARRQRPAPIVVEPSYILHPCSGEIPS